MTRMLANKRLSRGDGTNGGQQTRLQSSLLTADGSPAAQGFLARCGQLGIKPDVLRRYIEAIDPVTRKQIAGVYSARVAREFGAKKNPRDYSEYDYQPFIEGIFRHGPGASERAREKIADLTGRRFNRNLALLNGRVRERASLMPALFFDVYQEANEANLPDTEILKLVFQFIDASHLMVREQREFEKSHRKHQGRRKDYLKRLRRRLADILDQGDADAHRRFSSVWLHEVLQIEYSSLTRLGAVDTVASSLDECRKMLALFDKLINEPVKRGPRRRHARQRVVRLVRQHFSKLTRKKFSWSADGGTRGPGFEFVANLFALIKCSAPTSDDFRNPRERA